MRDAYAVFPDGNSSPAAVFIELEEAIDWGLTRYGADAFCIRGLAIEPVQGDPAAAVRVRSAS
jgi:hypothetical protein